MRCEFRAFLFLLSLVYLPISCFAQDKDTNYVEELILKAESILLTDVETAEACLSEAIYLSKEFEDHARIADSYNFLALIRIAQFNFSQAPRLLDDALSLKELHKDLGIESRSYSTYGALYYELGEYKKSIEALRVSMNRDIIENSQLNVGFIWMNIGLMYTQLEVQDSSEYYLNSALQVFSELDHAEGIVMTLLNLSESSLAFAQPDKAAGYLQAIEGYELIEEKPELKAWYLLYKGESLCQLQYMDSTLFYFSQVEELAKENSLNNVLSALYPYWIECAESHSDLELAYQISKASLNLKDSMQKEFIDHSLQAAFATYENKLMAKGNQMLKTKNELARTKIIALICICVLLTIVGVFVWNAIRQKYKKSEVEKELLESKLVAKIDRLSDYSKLLAAKFKKEQELVTSLQNTLKKNSDSVSKMIDIKEIVKNNTTVEYWEEFKIEFDRSFPKFLETLTKYHPNLSEKETQISVYTFMNFSSKKVASIMNIAPTSVDQSKYRLKKKILDGSNENLHSYLKSLQE